MQRASLLLAAMVSVVVAACQQPAAAAERAVAAPAAARIAKESTGLKTAIFAGGCFWGVEGVFSHVKGVTSAVSGFHGGSKKSASYSVVSSGMTDHAEAVKVTYDPRVVRYDELLRIFFSVAADPTQLNRQGPDKGPQYRSALVPTSPEQAAVAKAYLAQLSKAKLWSNPIVTRIEQPSGFFPAEGYHQDFMLRNPRSGYVLAWDAPKLKALEAMYPGHYTPRFQRN